MARDPLPTGILVAGVIAALVIGCMLVASIIELLP